MIDWSAPALRHMTTKPRIRHCERMMRTATSVRERETYRAEIRRLRGESELPRRDDDSDNTNGWGPLAQPS